MGKWYSRKPIENSDSIVPVQQASPTTTTSNSDEEDFSKLWCYCSQPSFGNMVMCDNKKCSIVWFHFDCLRIRCPPKGKWYCPSCRKLKKFSKK